MDIPEAEPCPLCEDPTGECAHTIGSALWEQVGWRSALGILYRGKRAPYSRDEPVYRRFRGSDQ